MRIPPTILATLAAAALAGCQGGGAGSASKELGATQFEDVPAPAGFALDASEGRSFSYSEGSGGPASIRLGRLEYTGRGDPGETLAWYAAEMPRPLHGWGEGVAVAGDPPSMRFERGRESCVVTAKIEGGGVRIIVERNVGRAVPAQTETETATAPAPEATR